MQGMTLWADKVRMRSLYFISRRSQHASQSTSHRWTSLATRRTYSAPRTDSMTSLSAIPCSVQCQSIFLTAFTSSRDAQVAGETTARTSWPAWARAWTGARGSPQLRPYSVADGWPRCGLRYASPEDDPRSRHRVSHAPARRQEE